MEKYPNCLNTLHQISSFISFFHIDMVTLDEFETNDSLLYNMGKFAKDKFIAAFNDSTILERYYNEGEFNNNLQGFKKQPYLIDSLLYNSTIKDNRF